MKVLSPPPPSLAAGAGWLPVSRAAWLSTAPRPTALAFSAAGAALSLPSFPRPRVRLWVCPSVRPWVCPSVCLWVCPSVGLSVCGSVGLSVCPSVGLSVRRLRRRW